jgi:sarcosine oxidase subunit beta
VETRGGRVRAVCVATSGGEEAGRDRRFVNAAGPLVNDVGRMLGLDLPIFSELHLKLALEDRRGVIPRDAPLVIWEDAQHLPWSAEERAALAESEADALSARSVSRRRAFPPRRRSRRADGAAAVGLSPGASAADLPVPLDPEFPEIVLRGMTTLAPGLAALPGAAAQELRGRRLLHQDARESPADRPAAGGRRVHLGRALRLRA